MKLRYLIFLFLLSLVSACSQQIEGRIFLDRNGNNIADLGEFAISGLPYTVTHNDGYYGQGVTETGGKFLVVLEGLNSEGTYCVKVDPKTLSPQNPPKVHHSGKVKSLLNDSSESDACTIKLDDSPDCNDENCCGEPECEAASVCQEDQDDEEDGNETEESDECPTDENNQPICSDSRCESRSDCNTNKITVNSMETCGEMAKNSLVMNMDVPVPVDYSSRAEQYSYTLPQPVMVGDLIEIDITYPSSCDFDFFTLPAPFFPEGLKGLYNEKTGEFSLDKAVNLNVSRVRKDDKTPLGHDPLHTYTLFLRVVGGPETQDPNYVIQPSLICPDGQRVEASATTIPFSEGSEISVRSEIAPHCPAPGASATVSSEIANPTNQPLTQVSFKLSLIGSDHVDSFSNYPDYCLNKGDSLECEIDVIEAWENKTIPLEFELDDTVSPGSTLTFAPELIVDQTVYSDSPITCNY